MKGLECWKPGVEGHVKLITMYIHVDMEDMTFYSLVELNSVLMEKVSDENRRPFEELIYSRYDLFVNEKKEILLPLPSSHFKYLERKTVKARLLLHGMTMGHSPSSVVILSR